MFDAALLRSAEELLAAMRARKLKLVTAESCTGGLLSGLLTEIPGSSDVFDRGFVTYSNWAKEKMLGVPPPMIERHGAVSAPVAGAMAEGALQYAPADMSVAITGIAGPDGGTAEKPVGLVFFAAARRGYDTIHDEQRFGNIGRTEIRLKSLAAALALARRIL